MERKVHGLFDCEPSVSASCGPVDEAMVSAKRGVVVPMPTASAEFGEMEGRVCDDVAHLDCDTPEKSTLNAEPSYVRPVPAVVVATPVHPWFVYARTWPGVPVKMVFVVVETVRVRLPPRTERPAVTESAEFAEETVPVATEPNVVRPLVLVKYERPEIAMSEVVLI